MRVAHYLTRGETGRYYVRLRIRAAAAAALRVNVCKCNAKLRASAIGTWLRAAVGHVAICCALLLPQSDACLLPPQPSGWQDRSGLDERLKRLRESRS